MRKNLFFIFFLLFYSQTIFSQCPVILSPLSLVIAWLGTWLGWLVLAWIGLTIVFAAYKFVTSEGNPEEVSKAKKMILVGLLGGGIVIGVGYLVNLITGC
ncbi:MAG: hypothetical protein ACPLZH_00145 [Minisyncoccales bacterium]